MQRGRDPGRSSCFLCNSRQIGYIDQMRLVVFLSVLGLAAGCGSSDTAGGGGAPGGGGTGNSDVDFTTFEWTEVNADARWAARAGLHTVELGGRFYLMGGRTPLDPATLPFPIPGASEFWADVWVSEDEGATWEQILASDTPGHWAPRAYFQATVKGNAMYIMGGQDFGMMSNFQRCLVE